MRDIDACIMASGGMDSTTLIYKLLSENVRLRVIFINYGQHFFETELSALKNVLSEDMFNDMKIIDISSIYTESNSPLIKKYDLWQDVVIDEMLYVPFRSLVMVSSAMAYTQSIGVNDLYAAFIDSNFVKDIDATSNFFDHLEKTTDIYESVKLRLPLRSLNKIQVLELGISLGAPVGQSFSCQVSSNAPCGACPNCVDRENAIAEWYRSNL